MKLKIITETDIKIDPVTPVKPVVNPPKTFNEEIIKQCLTCTHYTEEDHGCAVADKVIQSHGEELLEKWIKNPNRYNWCKFYKP